MLKVTCSGITNRPESSVLSFEYQDIRFPVRFTHYGAVFPNTNVA